MDREAWWDTVHGVTKSWTWLCDQTTTTTWRDLFKVNPLGKWRFRFWPKPARPKPTCTLCHPKSPKDWSASIEYTRMRTGGSHGLNCHVLTQGEMCYRDLKVDAEIRALVRMLTVTASKTLQEWKHTQSIEASTLPSVKWALVKASSAGHNAILGVRFIFHHKQLQNWKIFGINVFSHKRQGYGPVRRRTHRITSHFCQLSTWEHFLNCGLEVELK